MGESTWVDMVASVRERLQRGKHRTEVWFLRSQRGPIWKSEASDKLRSAHPAFALELNLQQQKPSFPAVNQDAAISDSLDRTCLSGDTMHRQSTMDLEFLR